MYLWEIVGFPVNSGNYGDKVSFEASDFVALVMVHCCFSSVGVVVSDGLIFWCIWVASGEARCDGQTEWCLSRTHW